MMMVKDDHHHQQEGGRHQSDAADTCYKIVGESTGMMMVRGCSCCCSYRKL